VLCTENVATRPNKAVLEACFEESASDLVSCHPLSVSGLPSNVESDHIAGAQLASRSGQRNDKRIDVAI
jgi:hypothetical protein